MNERTRRAWSRPELIVLVRGKPEEAVLGACKAESLDTSYGAYQGGCNVTPCNSCASLIGS